MRKLLLDWKRDEAGVELRWEEERSRPCEDISGSPGGYGRDARMGAIAGEEKRGRERRLVRGGRRVKIDSSVSDDCECLKRMLYLDWPSEDPCCTRCMSRACDLSERTSREPATLTMAVAQLKETVSM